MIGFKDLDQDITSSSKHAKSYNVIITSIVLMSLVFTFDSILTAIDLTNKIENSTITFIVIAIAINGFLLMLLSYKVATF
jgi:predicted tellurium resistance membrane protein TerC